LLSFKDGNKMLKHVLSEAMLIGTKAYNSICVISMYPSILLVTFLVLLTFSAIKFEKPSKIILPIRALKDYTLSLLILDLENNHYKRKGFFK